ncbi:hypothetical protein Landi51_11449 [Colletotrichum acutatum]
MGTDPQRRMLNPSRESDWEDRKEFLYDLYMLKNLSLAKVVEEMSVVHSFRARCPSTADDHFDVGGPPTPRQDTIMNPATLLPMEICVNSVPILSGRGANLHNIGDLTSLPANEGSQNLTAADYEVKDLIGSQALATIISACISLFSAGLTLTLSPKISMGMKSFFDKDNQLGYEKNLQQNKSRPLPLRAVHIASYMDTESFTGVDDLTESLNEAHEQICQLQSTLAGLTRAMQEFRGCRHDGGIL